MGDSGPETELVEAIARRVVELLRDEQPPESAAARLVDAATLARELGVERDWVYAHAEQLGAIRLGGPHGRLRFDRREVGERLGGADAASWRPGKRSPRRSSRVNAPKQIPGVSPMPKDHTQRSAGAS